MPQIIQTLGVGVDFDGTAGMGLLDFNAASPTRVGDDTTRIQILSVCVSAPITDLGLTLANVAITFGATLAGVFDDGNGLVFTPENNMTVHDFSIVTGFVIPPQWQGFVFSANGDFMKTLICDYRRVTLAPHVEF